MSFRCSGEPFTDIVKAELPMKPPGLFAQTWLQRSPPRLLAAAACSGLGSALDCRTRRALLHLSYSCASPFGPATLVTHDPTRTSIGSNRPASRPFKTFILAWRP